MSTKHVVLGLVIERSGYGYDLQQRIDQRFGFLGLSDTVVYRALDRLEEDGHVVVSRRKEYGQTRRGSPRIVYSATPTGQNEFLHWMAQPIRRALVREELHVKLVLAEPRDYRELIEQSFAIEEQYVAELRSLTRPPLHELVDSEMPWREVASILVDDACATRLQGSIEWLQRVRGVMRRRLADLPASDQRAKR